MAHRRHTLLSSRPTWLVISISIILQLPCLPGTAYPLALRPFTPPGVWTMLCRGGQH